MALEYMDENKPAVNTPEPAAVQTVVVDDNEAKIAALETEKAKLTEEAANYKLAFFKEKSKAKDEDFVEDDDDRMTRIAKKALAESRLTEIAREQNEIIQRALKENKELKLARLNKNEPPASAGTHSESTPVRDTLVTADQMAAFKARKWSDKDIERYKKNLQRYGGR